MTVRICKGKSCSERWAAYLEKRLKSDREKFAYDVEIEDGTCQWNCKNGPNMVLDEVFFEKMNPSVASQALANKIKAIRHSVNSKKWK